jgi:hypothetical protein
MHAYGVFSTIVAMVSWLVFTRGAVTVECRQDLSFRLERLIYDNGANQTLYDSLGKLMINL